MDDTASIHDRLGRIESMCQEILSLLTEPDAQALTSQERAICVQYGYRMKSIDEPFTYVSAFVGDDLPDITFLGKIDGLNRIDADLSHRKVAALATMLEASRM